jgi:hypothetical protein
MKIKFKTGRIHRQHKTAGSIISCPVIFGNADFPVGNVFKIIVYQRPQSLPG